MTHELIQTTTAGMPDITDSANSPVAGQAVNDFSLQCLRILRCTAKAMASSPGGLRFKAGTRPWLEGLSLTVQAGQGGKAGRRAVAAQFGAMS